MTVDVWRALAARHLWFQKHLMKLIAEWPEDEKLEQRARRHQRRVARHTMRGLVLVETSPTYH